MMPDISDVKLLDCNVLWLWIPSVSCATIMCQILCLYVGILVHVI